MPARKTPAKSKPAAKKAVKGAVPAKTSKKRAAPKTIAPKKPTAKQIETMKQEDAGFNMATQDAVKFLQSRRQAVFNIARQYHLDPDELMQEGFEVLLTCLRDFSPVFEKADGSWITVQFTTFFGSRMDSKGMELRNTNPEYQARQAHMNEMSDGEKARFREDPPLLVQHLDQENPMQEMLRGEAAQNRDEEKENIPLKWARDSFFDQKLSELVAREQDTKKRAILLQVKMGGVFNFQEMAYHFGVTDSRASQLLNELMDAFYVQRMIDGNVESVAYDFKKLKFNVKRVHRLVQDALTNATPQRQESLLGAFQTNFPELGLENGTEAFFEAPQEASLPTNTAPPVSETQSPPPSATMKVQPTALKDVLTNKEKQHYPNIGVERRKLSDLKPLSQDFRPPNMRDYIGAHIHQMVTEPDVYPLMITEEGLVIDGARRLQALQELGDVKNVSCKVFHVPDEQEAYMLRIGVNIRLMDAEKIDLYWAIVALASLGLSQQKIANTLGISRTNVIVYAKVKDKAAPALRQLYEDGLIQITNASSCVDFSEKIQERLSHFIRAYGAAWGKGSQFSELFQAAKQGRLSNLEKKTAAQQTVAPAPIQSPSLAEPHEHHTIQTQAHSGHGNISANMQERLQAYENALRDAEIWTAQRESVINRQTEEISSARTEIEGLKKELEAAELLKFGDQNQMKEALKELKAFVNLTERMAAATNNTRQAVRSLRTLNPTRAQLVELQEGLDSIEQHVNALRVEVANKAARKKLS